MKYLTLLILVGSNVFASCFSSVNLQTRWEGEAVAATPTPTPTTSLITDACVEENYSHKSEAQLAAMTPVQLIDEEVKEQLYHMPSFDNYGFLIYKYVRKAGVKILPVLIQYVNEYDPKTPSKCERTRFYVASEEMSGLDRGLIRIRSVKDGQVAVEAIERAVDRMKNAGFDKKEHKYSGYFDFAMLVLKGLKGINERDVLIRDTLRRRHDVQMTDAELLEFSNFLVSLDPTYPTWSEIGEYGPPALLKDPNKYFEAYLKFKVKK